MLTWLQQRPVLLLAGLAALGVALLTLTAEDAQSDMALRGLLVLILFGGLGWLVVSPVIALFAPKGPLKPRYQRPGRAGLPDAERMRRDIKLACMALMQTGRLGQKDSIEQPPAEWLIADTLHAKIAKISGKGKGEPSLGARIAALAPAQLAEVWALNALLAARPEDRKTAYARFRKPRKLEPLVDLVEETRAKRRTYEEEREIFNAAAREWERNGTVDPGDGGLLGLLQREAADDPAFLHQVLCGLEPPVDGELLRWLLTRPNLNAGSLAHWLGQEASLGYLSGTVLRSAKAGDGTLDAIREAIERWNAGGFPGPVWQAPEGRPEKDLDGPWKREMGKIAAKLGEVPLPDPEGLFEAPRVAPPEPSGPYRYSHRDGLTVPPPAPEAYFSHLRR